MDQNLQQLAQYVGQQLRQGVSEQNIRTALAQNKWTQDWINAAFNVVRQNPGMFGLVTAQQPFPASTAQQLPPAQPIYAEAPSEPNEELEKPRSKERKPKSKRLWIFLVSAAVLLGLAIAAYFIFQPNQGNTPGSDTKQVQSEPPAPEKPKDEQRKDDLNTMLSNLADYYVANKYYPTLAKLRDATFLSQNPSIDSKAFADPAWTNVDACNAENKAILADKPTPHCYAYQATAQDGAACNNATVFCTKLKVTIITDDGKSYTITLHANTQVEN